MPVLGDADDNSHFLTVPRDNLRSISLDRPDELAETLLGFLQLPAIAHHNLHFYLDSLDRIPIGSGRRRSSAARPGRVFSAAVHLSHPMSHDERIWEISGAVGSSGGRNA